MTTVDISGLDKVELLRNLWTNMKPASFFNRCPTLTPEFDLKKASHVINGYIDYFQ